MSYVINKPYTTDRPDLDVQYYDGKTIRHIGHIVTSVTVSGDMASPYRKCDISLVNTVDGERERVKFQLVHEIRVYVGKYEVFRGPLFAYTVDSDGQANITAYDYNYYLTKSTDSRNFEKRKASDIIRQLCKWYGIPVGNIADTGYILPKLHLREKSIYDMMVIALTETEKKNGRTFAIVNRGGKLNLIERKKELTRIILENKKTLLSASYSKSNEERKTQVKLVGNVDKRPIGTTVRNAESVRKYGVMQHYEVVQDETNKAKLDAMARQLLKKYDVTKEEYSVEALGIHSVKAGTAVVVNDRMTGMSGAFYVDQDTHKFDASGLHTMSLKLTRTLDIPREDYEAPEEKKAVTKGSALSNAKYVGGYIGTAYDPRLGGINADGNPNVTATGTRWAYNRTIAVNPSIIPYGSVVAIRVPSLPQYNGIYLAEDTGGAIRRENGGKRIDVLLRGRSLTSKFGRRPVEVAILERGKGPSDARAKAKNWPAVKAKFNVAQTVTHRSTSSKARAVVDGAMRFRGKLRYSFGGNNIPRGYGDCSAYTQYIYKTYAGINIGRDTLTQVKKGRSIPKAQAQPGDLIFFAGTYRRGVSHVGIVTRPGYFVNLASSGCYETSYMSNRYWTPKLHSFRRVL